MKAIGMIAFSCFCGVAACAQHVKEARVPAKVKMAFSKEYPQVPAKWEKEGKGYEVNFKKDGKSMSLVIDNMGSITETETGITVAELPTLIAGYVKQHYMGAKITEASKIVDAKGTPTYEARVKDKDVIFDSNGKFLKEAKG